MSKKKGRNQMRNNVVSVNFEKPQQINLIPKSLNQEKYIYHLQDSRRLIIFAVGPAGTGKTMLAVLAGLQQLKRGNINKIIITRPAIGVDDEKHGFLPGDLNEKMEPWTKPIFDVIEEYYDKRQVEVMLEKGTIEISPLAYMRGRTFKNAWVIADEMQNSTPNQMKMLLTRIGENSKMVVTGDIYQTDQRFVITNGLLDFKRLAEEFDSEYIVMADFVKQDIMRHPVVSEVLEIYGDI